MTITIALCDGHGMETAGKRSPFITELGRFVHENEFNRAVVNYLDIELRRCGIDTLLVAPTDVDTPLQVRTDLANAKKVDAYVSIHFDASDSKFDGEGKDPEGHTIYVWTGQRNKASGKLAECVLKYLNQGTPQQNRGIKEADFHVLRETNMIALLSENGFMDNKKEALWMVDAKFQKEVAIEHAKGLCEYFKVSYKGETFVQPSQPTPQSTPSNLYRIRKSWSDVKSQVGAFGILQSAIDVAKQNAGYNVYDSNGTQVYPTAPKPVVAPKPTPVVQPKHKYVILPASEKEWRIYPLNKAAIKVNALPNTLKPARFNGLEYEILKDRGNWVFEIQTSNFGRVQIYANPSATSARIIEK